MERAFQISAAVLASVAAYFLWTDGAGDRPFVAGAMAVVAGFLSYRSRLKARAAKRDAGR